ncbi:hypothetical protein HTZ84_22505 [Haloterrigena sp. SYSU A558-1]|uniref:Helix-hairpin-helix domain-containing protein n=1 Tax=Haloterrigena gelatinilytica TaxID=2741724 RepID=A0ABX2LFL0_9EURY|nr:helix-hairpin-helix domain-containing protein [Haloterrigena gelatinilytica]NUC75040.1 hypothetical protein [Haloterrigena gelatinilytica]
MLETLETLVYILVLTVVCASAVRDRLESDPDPIEAAKQAHVNGEIDLAEYERRLEFHIDDRNEQIRTVVEDVNRVGPDTSKAIAREYDSLDELRASDQERLEGVPGIGEELAAAVLERVRE